jgi:hypothetical protein
MDWGLVSSAVFGISTIILTIKLVRKKKPVWAYSTRHIIGRDAEAPPELKYIFGEKVVEEVYKTTIIFFNIGDDKFCGDLVLAGNNDINDAIVIQFKEAEILRSPTITNRSKGAGKFSVEQSKNCIDSIQLHIPTLNHNDGAIIEVWHTKSSKIDIQNADIPLLKEFIRQRPEGFWSNLIFFSLLIAGGLTFAGFGIASYISESFIIVPSLFACMLIVMATFGFPRLLRYRIFPSWSRTNEKTQKQ